MTYNKKSKNSETLQHLVKIAIDKGMIKNDSSVVSAIKSASLNPTLNLNPSDDVQESILRLVAGLTAAGLSTYAEKLEGRLMAVKFAQTAEQVEQAEDGDVVTESEPEAVLKDSPDVSDANDKSSKSKTPASKAFVPKPSKSNTNDQYGVHSETGEDVLNNAHPEGSVEILPSQEGHGTIQTKVEKHEKFLNIVQKAKIINSLKLALGIGSVNFPEWAGLFGKAVQEQIVTPLSKFHDAKVVGGKFETVGDYFTSWYNLKNGINDIPNLMERYKSSWLDNKSTEGTDLRKTILGNSAKLMNEYVFDLLAAIERAIKQGSVEFTNKNYATEAYAHLAPLREMFNAIFSSENGDATAAAQHGSILPSASFSTLVAKTSEKLKNVIFLIDRYVLGDSDIAKYPAVKSWFDAEKTFITKCESDLQALSKAVVEHEKLGEHVNHADKGLVTLDVLKDLARKVDPGLFDDFDLTSVESFTTSVTNYSDSIKKDCRDTIQHGVTDQSLKTEMSSVFEVK